MCSWRARWGIMRCCETPLCWFSSFPVGLCMGSSVTEISGPVPSHGWNAGGRASYMAISQTGECLHIPAALPLGWVALVPRELWMEMQNSTHCDEWYFVATELCVLDTEISSPQDLGVISEQYLEGKYHNTSSRNMRKSYLQEQKGRCFKTEVQLL